MAIAVPAVIREARRRQRFRRRALGLFALAAAVALTATWGLGGLPGGGGPATTTFRSDDGWTITYPRAFHRLSFEYVPDPGGTNPGRGGRGVSIGNFWPLPDGPYSDVGIPSTGVLFVLGTGGIDGVGAKNVHFPLTLRDFPLFAVDPAHVRQAGPGSYDFQVGGHSFGAVVVAGRSASRADLHALAQLVSSVRFYQPDSSSSRTS